MDTKYREKIKLDDLLIEVDEDLSLATIDQGREKKFEKNQLQNELNSIVEEYAHSNEKIKELIEIYRNLIQKTDKNIEWLANSNTFKRIWRRVTGKTFRINLQNDQYLNDLNKIGLELFNQLNQKMLIQQQQLVWLQKEIQFFVEEQTQFRQKLKKQLELIIDASHRRFERIETALRDTTKSLLELKKELVQLGVRVDVIEREQAKIKHRLNTIEWNDKIQNKRNGSPDKYKKLDDHDFGKVTSFLNLIDEFLKNTEYSPTLIDYQYLEDVLGYYGFDKENYLYGTDILQLLVTQVSGGENESIEEVITNWNKRFGIVQDVIPRDLFNLPISPEQPFSSFTERVIYLIHQEVSQDNPITFESIKKGLLGYRLANSSKEKVIDHFLATSFETIDKFEDLRFDWFDIAKEYISFKKATLDSEDPVIQPAGQQTPLDQILRNPSVFLNEFNLQYKKVRQLSEVSSQIFGWKKKFPDSFKIIRFNPRAKVSLESEIKDYNVSITVHFEDYEKQEGKNQKRIRMAYLIPHGELNHFDFQGAKDFSSAFGGLKLNKKKVGSHLQIYFDWLDPDESFSNLEQLVNTISEKVIHFLSADTAYTNIVKEVNNKIDVLPAEFNDASLDEIIEESGGFRIKMKSKNINDLNLWKNNSGNIFETHGKIGQAYLKHREEEDATLGFPVSDEMPMQIREKDADANAYYQLFENGELKYWPKLLGGHVKIILK